MEPVGNVMQQTLGKIVLSAATVSAVLLGGAADSRAAVEQVSAVSYNRLCPQHIGGDREYKGHGPEVTTMVGLKRLNSQVYLSVDMHQIETRSDWSEAQLTRDYLLTQRVDGTTYTMIWAPDVNGTWGWRSIANGVFFDTWSDYYVDTNHSVRTVSSPKWWLSSVATNGDTGGNDIGNCTSDDAYISVRLASFFLWFQ